MALNKSGGLSRLLIVLTTLQPSPFVVGPMFTDGGVGPYGKMAIVNMNNDGARGRSNSPHSDE